jgi:hypothetical protein
VRIAAVRIGTSKGPDWAKEIPKAIEETYRKTIKPEVKKQFEDIVKGWNHQPSFAVKLNIGKSEIALSVWPTGKNREIWHYVSRGTRRHVIRPKGPGYPLAFQWGGPGSYRAKTSPRMGSYGAAMANIRNVRSPLTRGQKAGITAASQVYFMSVNHPGNAPREFEERVMQNYRLRFRALINTAIQTGKNRAWGTPYGGRSIRR